MRLYWREEEEERKGRGENGIYSLGAAIRATGSHGHDFRHASIADAALTLARAETAAGRLALRAKWKVNHDRDLKIKDMVGPAVVNTRRSLQSN